MAVQLDTLIQSNNFQKLSDRQKGQWLEAGNTGELRTVNGFFQKCWFVVRNFFSCGGVRARTAKAIDALCRKFFTDICLNCPSPMEANSSLLARYKDSIQKMARSVKQMTAKLCDQKLAQNIKDLNRCPEIVEAKLALDQGILPTSLAEGISGSYILYDRQQRPWAIFKPQEQEPGAAGNPKGFNDMAKFLSRIKIEAGTSFQREEAAYLLDHDHFSGVPLTAVAHLPRDRFVPGGGKRLMVGSFQKFVPSCQHAWEHYQILPWPLSGADGHKIPPHEIHKIAILDIRTLNCDRHLKNFLVDAGWHIHPIDHGYTIPGDASNLRFNWMNFNQSKVPFSQEELDYIERLDPLADAELLKEKIPSLSKEALLRFEVAGFLLKKAAKRGLTAYQIGELMCGARSDFLTSLIGQFIPLPLDKPSNFEKEICRNITRSKMDRRLDQEIDLYLGIRTVSLHSHRSHSG